MKTKFITVLLALALSVHWHDARAVTIPEVMAAMPSHFHPDKIRDINATVRYVITGQGVWNITVSGGRVIVDQSDRPADATITMSAEDFMGLQSGTLNPMTAFMAGRVAIQGDLDTVLRFQSVFGQ